MTQRPRKNTVKDIIKNLLDSEIPEIQDVAKQLAERIKQLEEHSWKLQHYVTEIENMAEEEPEVMPADSLSGLLKDLERTLDELRQAPKAEAARPEAARPEVEVKTEDEDLTSEERKPEEASTELRPGVALETYTTPEGFVVRKRYR